MKNIFNVFLRAFRLPTPLELGWTNGKYNALPVTKTPNDNTPTWGDWENKMRKEYPIQFFFLNILPKWFRWNVQPPIKNFFYWIKCHLFQKYRYHYLDLRQLHGLKSEKPYRYGWIDTDEKMLYAIFNILNEFVKNEISEWHWPSEEEVQTDPFLLRQRFICLETKAIHYWWNVERVRQMNEYNLLLNKWSSSLESKEPNARQQSSQLWDAIKKIEKLQEDKEDEMIGRLFKIRRSLWT